MRTLLLIALAVVCVVADISVQYAGTTTGAATWSPPTFGTSNSGASTCAGSSAVYSYVTFNATFPTAGVREVSAMAEQKFKESVRIYIYEGGFPSSPCANLNQVGDFGNQFDADGGPVIDAFVYFAATTYTFVVTGETGGIFAVHVDPSDAMGQTSPSSPLWAVPQETTTNTACSTGDTAGFGLYTWTQATSGQFDVFVFFNNNSIIDDVELYTAIYLGTPSVALITQDSCNASTVLGAVNTDNLGLYYPAFNLTAGQSYTLVFSLDTGYYGYWGVHVIPTRIRYFNGINGWEQPRGNPTSTPGCTGNSDYDSTPYGITVFTAQESVYVIDTSDPPAPFTSIDTYSFLYDGVNAGSPPATCPIGAPLVLAGDTGDVTPIYTFATPGLNYTVIVSSYQESPTITTNYVYVLYFYTGLPIGSIPAGSTSTSTTATTATNGVTGITGTTGTGTVTTSTGTGVTIATATTTNRVTVATTGVHVTTNSASQVGVTVFLALVALSALL